MRSPSYAICACELPYPSVPLRSRSNHNPFKGPEVVCTENVQNIIKAIFYFEIAPLKSDCGNCARILTFLSKDSYWWITAARRRKLA